MLILVLLSSNYIKKTKLNTPIMVSAHMVVSDALTRGSKRGHINNWDMRT